MANRNRKPTSYDVACGAELKRARRVAEVTQENVADHLGMTTRNYQRYEAGARRMLKSVYDKTTEFLVAIILAKLVRSSTGFSEMTRNSYSAPVTNEIIRQALKEIKETIRRLEKRVKG